MDETAAPGRAAWVRLTLGAKSGEPKVYQVKFWDHGGGDVVWLLQDVHKLLDPGEVYGTVTDWSKSTKTHVDAGFQAVGLEVAEHLFPSRQAWSDIVHKGRWRQRLEPQPTQPRILHDHHSITTQGLFALFRGFKGIQRRIVQARCEELQKIWLMTCSPPDIGAELAPERLCSDDVAQACPHRAGGSRLCIHLQSFLDEVGKQRLDCEKVDTALTKLPRLRKCRSALPAYQQLFNRAASEVSAYAWTAKYTDDPVVALAAGRDHADKTRRRVDEDFARVVLERSTHGDGQRNPRGYAPAHDAEDNSLHSC